LFFCFSKVFAVLVIVILDIYILYKISEALMFT
jgi:flagellar biogenesis protein FliO